MWYDVSVLVVETLCAVFTLFPFLSQHTVYDELVTQGDLMFIQSILEICSIELDEGGDYTCNATNGFISETNTTTITVTDSRGVHYYYVHLCMFEDVYVCVCKSDTTCTFGCTVVNLCTGSLLLEACWLMD